MGCAANSEISLGDVVCSSIQLRFLMMLEVTHVVYSTEESAGRLSKEGPKEISKAHVFIGLSETCGWEDHIFCEVRCSQN